jgi:hypothetical protein
VHAALDEEAERVEVPVRDSRKTFRRPISPHLGLTAGLLLLAALGPVGELAVGEPRASAPAQPGVAPQVTSPKVMLPATILLQRAVVTRSTSKLDLAAITPAEFGDWEEPIR